METILHEVKNKIDSVIEIAEKCPEKYQVKCFEILLSFIIGGHIKSNHLTIEHIPEDIPPVLLTCPQQLYHFLS